MKNSILRFRNAALLLLTSSLVLYGVNFLAFGRAPEIIADFLGNLAFLPIYVLFVTMMIERVIKERERDEIMQKLNMVIGVFFSEVGTELLRNLADFLMDSEDLSRQLRVTSHWTNPDFQKATDFLSSHDLKVNSRMGDLAYLRNFLMGKREFLLRLLENQNLLEHEAFTDLLWAVTHLLQELEARKLLTSLPETDLDHLSVDIKRAYGHLLREWLVYMRHLKKDYPHLFSLAVRMNPMDPEARPEVV
jgi:hypothetical protein